MFFFNKRRKIDWEVKWELLKVNVGIRMQSINDNYQEPLKTSLLSEFRVMQQLINFMEEIDDK